MLSYLSFTVIVWRFVVTQIPFNFYCLFFFYCGSLLSGSFSDLSCKDLMLMWYPLTNWMILLHYIMPHNIEFQHCGPTTVQHSHNTVPMFGKQIIIYVGITLHKLIKGQKFYFPFQKYNFEWVHQFFLLVKKYDFIVGIISSEQMI